MKKISIISAIIIIVISLFSCSCSKDNIIPKKELEDIYYELYTTDSYIKYTLHTQNLKDSTLVYEPIFNKYGYTSEDYINSYEYYLKKPHDFVKIFKAVKKRLEKKENYLIKTIAHNNTLDSIQRCILDSIQIKGNIKYKSNNIYRALNFTLYLANNPDFSKKPFSILDTFKKELDTFKKDTIIKDSIVKKIIIKDTIVKNAIVKNAIIKDSIIKDTIIINSLCKDSLLRNDLLKFYDKNLILLFEESFDIPYEPGYFVKGRTVVNQIKEEREKIILKERAAKEKEAKEKVELEKKKKESKNKKTIKKNKPHDKDSSFKLIDIPKRDANKKRISENRRKERSYRNRKD